MTRLTRAQGWYYLIGGLWPFVHFRSFQAVAGPKPDRFQTEVTSALFAASGAAIVVGARHPLGRVLACLSALGVAGVNWRHRHSVRPLFYAESGMEVMFALAAAAAPPGRRARPARRGRPAVARVLRSAAGRGSPSGRR
jgi:hypothetical protein